MNPVAEAGRIVRDLACAVDGAGVSAFIQPTPDGASVTVGKQVVHIRPDWSMSLAHVDETPLDWVWLSTESAVHWLRG